MSLLYRKSPALLVLLIVVAIATMLYGRSESADGLIVDPLDASFDESVYGDFITIGNTNMQCPQSGDTEYNAQCLTDATSAAQTVAANDSYYMRYFNSDISGAVQNSSSASFTVPAGADIETAKVYWSGNTGQADLSGTPYTACNASQVQGGSPPAALPGFGAQNQIKLAIDGGGYTTTTGTTQIEPTAGTGGRVYVSEADITTSISALSTGVAHTITGADIWTPEGNNCTGGWSAVIVWSFPTPNPSAPELRHIGLYDGFVRQRSTDPQTNTQLSGFISRIGTLDPRLSVIAYEGDQGIVNDQFLVNGSAIEEPRVTPAGTTTNFFASTTDGGVSPSNQNKWGIDAKTTTLNPGLIPGGATTVDLAFTTNGDTYYPQALAFSLTVRADGSSIAGTVFNDADGNGTLNGETGIGGVTVTLTGTDNEGTPVNSSTTTAPDGTYSFPALIPSNPAGYTITETQPTGYGSTTTNAITAVLGINEALTDQNFGDNLAAVSGTVFHDADASGVLNGESGIGGVTITLTGTNSASQAVNLSTTTAPDGTYSFTDLLSDDGNGYTITESQPVGYGSTTPNVISSVSVLPGTSVPGQDFGESLGSISGSVLEDTTGDGIGNGPIQNVTITLTGNDITGAPVSLTTTSSPSGTWSFIDLLQSDASGYTIIETQPTTHVDGDETTGTSGGTLSADDEISAIVLAAGANATNIEFVEVVPAALAGTVWSDTDADGIGDVGLTGVTVTLTGIDDRGANVSIVASTNGSGQFSFTMLRPSDASGYTVTETQPVTHADGPDVVGTTGGTGTNDATSAIVLAPGTAGTGYDFIEYPPATVSGLVFEDVNASTTFDGGDVGIDGVTVSLTGTNIDGDPVSRSMTTAGGGLYSFEILPPSDPTGYTITETQPAGYGNTTPDTITAVVVAVGQTITDQNFGDGRGLVSGSVFDDWNMNGVQDGAEPGIDGVTITLTGNDSTSAPVSLSTTTAGGLWNFAALAPSDPSGYTIAEDQPAGYLDHTDTAGSLGGTVTNDSISDLVVTPGATASGYNFAEVSPVSISGTVYEDDNGNSTIDGTESGIAGVDITISGLDAAGNTTSAVVTTNGTGVYTAANLYPSDGTGYVVSEAHPSGYLDGLDSAGSAGGSVGNDITSGVVLSAGTNATGYNFGELLPASLAGLVYSETDDDGLQEVGEVGISGVTIDLTGTDVLGQPVTRTAVTDGTGLWSLANLAPSNPSGYMIIETQPVGYFDGIDTAGTAGGVVAADEINTIVLGAGNNASGYTFAELLPASISGTVFHDIDENGILGSEQGLADVTITLVDSGGSNLTTTSGADGTYRFDNLAAGTYTIVETQPATWVSTTPDQLNVTLTPAGLSGQDFGEIAQKATIGDLVWNDRNANGTQDSGELGIGSVGIVVSTSTGSTVTTVATDAQGAYSVQLPAGTYSVSIDPTTVPTGMAASTPVTIAVTVTQGSSNLEVDFGFATTGSISGSVWNDRNGDAIIDPDELPEGAATVTLLNALGEVVARTITNPDGTYRFDGLLPGEYTLEFTTPDGKSFTPAGLVDPATGKVLVSVLEGAETRDMDAGLVVPESLAFTGASRGPQLVGTALGLLLLGLMMLGLAAAIVKRRERGLYY